MLGIWCLARACWISFSFRANRAMPPRVEAAAMVKQSGRARAALHFSWAAGLHRREVDIIWMAEDLMRLATFLDADSHPVLLQRMYASSVMASWVQAYGLRPDAMSSESRRAASSPTARAMRTPPSNTMTGLPSRLAIVSSSLLQEFLV